MIRIEPERIHSVIFRIRLIFHGIVPRFFAHVIVIVEGLSIKRTRFASVPERRIHEPLVLRKRITEIRIVVRNGIRRAERRNDGIQHQKQDDDCTDDRSFVLAKPTEGVLKISDGFRLEFLIVRNIAPVGKFKFFSRDVFKAVFHIILPPFVFSDR